MKKIILVLPIFLLFACGGDVEVKTDENQVADNHSKTDKSELKTDKKSQNEVSGQIKLTMKGETFTFTNFDKPFTGGQVIPNLVALKAVTKSEDFKAIFGVQGTVLEKGLTGEFNSKDENTKISFSVNGKKGSFLLKEGVLTSEVLESNRMKLQIKGIGFSPLYIDSSEEFEFTMDIDLSGCEISGI